ncbi:MAG: diversity-generating retroelement protein Avd [Chloroflexota bacterium]|nr:diversity-generating retroelement protein Avd [Chloroflexota bacterium]
MSDSAQSPIFIRTEAFALWLLSHLKGYPRQERFRLTARIEGAMFSFHESLLYAAKTNQTVEYLQKADAELDMLRTYLRFALELQYIDPEKYHYIAEQMSEIGRLLGGWLKKPRIVL